MLVGKLANCRIMSRDHADQRLHSVQQKILHATYFDMEPARFMFVSFHCRDVYSMDGFRYPLGWQNGGAGQPDPTICAYGNKNRLCSMTCGIYKIYKIDRLVTKRSFIGAAEGAKQHLNEKKRSHPKRNWVRERQILINPAGSHPEEKSGQGATYLDRSQRIPPRRKFWVGNKEDGYWTSKKVDLDLW